MKLSVCITTRNRPQELSTCLSKIWLSSVKPYSVAVSDDSPEEEVQMQNRQIVAKYPGTVYLLGPRTGVCSNRNNALNSITDTNLVAFIDDDVILDTNFIAFAIARYAQMEPVQRSQTILTGKTCNQFGHEIGSIKLSWQGYFCAADIPQAVNIHATVFPWSFCLKEKWDENIFFGYEDAELCLRALSQGYQIIYCSELKALHSQYANGTLELSTEGMSDYEVYIEAARLYVGIKRYVYIFPNFPKLFFFLALYFSHMTIYLLKRNSLSKWTRIIYYSKWKKLL